MTEKVQALESLFRELGNTDFKWLDPQDIIVSQWVRMKCMFGCGEYGHSGACPPNTPTVVECERFFKEYTNAVILHFIGKMGKPEDRHAWSRKINAGLVKLEREVFLAGYERAFSSILDANITTLIAAVILFGMGSGPVRGFAVTLGIGILSTVFTAYTVTRLIIAFWVRTRRPKSVPL